MWYLNVVYEFKNGVHILHVDMDGQRRDLVFPYIHQAMELRNQLQVYCRLRDRVWVDHDAA